MEIKLIKNFNEVIAGDEAYTSPDAGGEDNVEYLGDVLFVANNIQELRESKYSEQAETWVNELDMSDEDFDEYDLIIVNLYGWPTLFNYNNDPCGVVVFKQTNENEDIN